MCIRDRHVVQVTYITPEEALEKLKVDWDMEGILDGFDKDSNPLSSSFEVSLDNIENQNYVLTELEKIDGVRNIRPVSYTHLTKTGGVKLPFW